MLVVRSTYVLRPLAMAMEYNLWTDVEFSVRIRNYTFVDLEDREPSYDVSII